MRIRYPRSSSRLSTGVMVSSGSLMLRLEIFPPGRNIRPVGETMRSASNCEKCALKSLTRTGATPV